MINNNMISNTSKMEIMMFLMNQNVLMQNQIKMNNIMINKLFQETFQIPSFNSAFQNNNQNCQGINNCNMQNNNSMNNNCNMQNNFNMQNNCNIQNNFNNNNSNESNFTDDFPGYLGKRISIFFIASTGFKIKMNPPENIKISELLSKFMKKIKLSENLIDKNLFFIFNGAILKKDDNRNISELGISNNGRITIVDLNNYLSRIEI